MQESCLVNSKTVTSLGWYAPYLYIVLKKNYHSAVYNPLYLCPHMYTFLAQRL